MSRSDKVLTIDLGAAVEELTANPVKAKAVEAALVKTIRDVTLRLYRETRFPGDPARLQFVD